MKHNSGKKILLYSMVFTFLFVGYESVEDIVLISMDSIQAYFSSTSAGSEEILKNEIHQNHKQKRTSGAVSMESGNTEEHWRVTGWPIDDLSTAAEADYLSDLEKDVVLHLNMARTNPPKYAKDFIAPRTRYYKGKLYREPWESSDFGGYVREEGIEAVRECVSVMEQTSPISLLLPSEGLSFGARDHAFDQSCTGDTGHAGSDGSKPSTRLNRYGEWLTVMGENVSYGPVSGREIVVSMLVDDGVPNRGHRRNILNSQFHVVGVSIKHHPVYRYVCVIDFAGDYEEE